MRTCGGRGPGPSEALQRGGGEAAGHHEGRVRESESRLCQGGIADLATAHGAKAEEAERLKKDAEAQTRRALDEAARARQEQQDTARHLMWVGKGTSRPRLYACRNGTKLRTKKPSRPCHEAPRRRGARLSAEDAASDARDRAWRHHRSAAETKSLAGDVRRLVKLLASTEEYRRRAVATAAAIGTRSAV